MYETKQLLEYANHFLLIKIFKKLNGQYLKFFFTSIEADRNLNDL